MVDLQLSSSPPVVRRDFSGLVAPALSWLANFVLPPQCPGCGAGIEAVGALCGSCWSRVDFIAEPFCDQLGIPFPHEAGEGALSAQAIAMPPPYARARAVARYDDMARQLVHKLKYKDRLDVAPLMGSWMLRAGRELVEESDFIAPVPLYRSRLWRRRFNQSGLLAARISALSGLCLAEDMLTRTRPTRSQVGLSTDERRRNVAGAFAIGGKWASPVNGKTVLLVDDVITTGATVEACTKALLRAGAARVNILAFARVIDPVRLPV